VQWRYAQTGTVSSEPLSATIRFRDDPDTPYKMMLPLATELARSLGVARRITDDSPLES
jgi:hypothetical protein